MDTIELLKSGFANTVFVNKSHSTIRGVILRVINNPKVVLFPNKPNGIKIEPINETSDKVTLSFDNEEVTSIWTWRKSEDGKSYVLSKIE
jgi:hypothetical protein